MSQQFRAAAVQMCSGMDWEANLATAARLVERAAEQGAKLVVLPEYFGRLGHLQEMVAHAEPIPGPTSEAMRGLAAKHQITLLAGSICERAAGGKARNTSLLFDPQGRELGRYRKMHLPCVDLPGAAFDEARWIAAGSEVAATETPLGRVGHATCYDLRFPELFRRLAERGMRVLLFPSAFTATTGLAHWEVLLRARAIENQTFVVAANQYGQHTENLASHGHSMIVDPWGVVLAEVSAGDAVATADLDFDRLEEVRHSLPVLTHRRL